MIAPCLVGRAILPNATYFLQNGTTCINCGADPLVRAGPPGPALPQRNQLDLSASKPARGPAADQGVRPTNLCFSRSGSAAGRECLRHATTPKRVVECPQMGGLYGV